MVFKLEDVANDGDQIVFEKLGVNFTERTRLSFDFCYRRLGNTEEKFNDGMIREVTVSSG